jgi:hypothetical protein
MPAAESHVKPAPPRPPPQRRITLPIVVSGVISGAAIASGVVFSISAASSYSSYKAQPDHQVGLAGERSMFIADVSFGVAALFGLAALALYFFPDEEEPKTSASLHHPARVRWYVPALEGQVLQF